MTDMLTVPKDSLEPSRETLLRDFGYPASHRVPDRVRETLEQAYTRYRRSARPRALVRRIHPDNLVPLLGRRHRSHPVIPLDHVLSRAGHALLFACTLGPDISRQIAELFHSGEYTVATFLDRIASRACDRTGRWITGKIEARYPAGGKNPGPVRFVLYSPGYCGWKLSAQVPLFDRLNPGQIGISLNERHLMDPLKSVTGILAGGSPAIHRFSPRYPFCETCRDRTCHRRQESVSLKPSH